MGEESQKGTGASPVGDRAFVPSASSPQAVSPVPASIPSAWRRTMQMDWSLDAGVITLIYPGDLSHVDINDLEDLLAVAVSGMRRRASAIEARQGEDAQRLHAQHESAVPKADAQDTPPSPDTGE